MRFSTTSLLAVTTIIAIFLGLIGPQPVAALAFVSAYFAVRALAEATLLPRSTRRLIWIGGKGAFIGMMIFGLSTTVFWVAYSFWIAPNAVLANSAYYFDYLWKFVLVYGVCSLMGGSLLGLVCSLLIKSKGSSQ